MRFYPLEKLINLEEGYCRQFRIDHLQLLLIQRGGRRYLIEGQCPHRGHSLAVASIESGEISCALHHYRFSLADGSLLQHAGEPCRALRTWELVYEGNEIGVMLAESARGGY